MDDLENLEQDFLSQGSTVLEKLDEWVIKKGDKPCIYYGDENRSLTYREFNSLCNQVANGLAAIGVEKGDRVSVLSENALVTTIAMFSIWKLAAVYCPICNHYKGDLLAYILNDTGSTVLLLDQKFVEDINQIATQASHLKYVVTYQPVLGDHDYGLTVITELDRAFQSFTWKELLAYPDTELDKLVAEGDVANIIYTSGTTGYPKGVVQSHNWMHGYCYLNLRRAFANPEYKTIIYNDLPLYHVGGAIFNVVSALWGGNQLALWDRFSAREFWWRINKSGATQAIFIDVMIDWLLKNSPSSDEQNNSLSLAFMTPLPSNCLDVAKRFGIDFIMSGYGSTEIGVGFFGLIDVFLNDQGRDQAANDIIREDYGELCSKPAMDSSGAINRGFMGVPSPLMDVAVLDDKGKRLGPNVPGQVVFKPRLPGLILREYFNKPGQTTEAIKDGWYHSPDFVRYDDYGNFYFEDRQEGFIRVRGENVSASAVEAQLNNHDVVHRSAVVGIPAIEGNEQDIVAFVVNQPGADLTAGELKEWAKDMLPKFMQPKHIRFIEDFPVTRTFKIEKYKLKKRILEELSR